MVSQLANYLRRHHLALVALFIALGGTSYAATQLPAQSVGTRQLKNGAVTMDKLSAQARRALKGERGRRGAAGAAGPPGPAGGVGPPGPQGLAGSARAYGEVSAAGVLSVAVGDPAVTHPFTGDYCITAPGLDPSTTRPLVTLGRDSSLDAAAPNEGVGICPAGAFDIVVGRYVTSNAGVTFVSQDEPFFFAIP